MKTISERIKHLADNQGVSIRQIEASIGASNGVLAKSIKTGTDIGSKWLEKIIYTYSINPDWLITGRGDMFAVSNKLLDVSIEGNSNSTLTLSAGRDLKNTGSIKKKDSVVSDCEKILAEKDRALAEKDRTIAEKERTIQIQQELIEEMRRNRVK